MAARLTELEGDLQQTIRRSTEVYSEEFDMDPAVLKQLKSLGYAH